MKSLVLGVALAALALAVSPARAIIIHPLADGQAVPAPSASVIGQFAGSSAVAIAPNFALASRHQGGGVGSPITFGGTSYVVAAVEDLETPLTGGGVANADLRVLRLETPGGQAANLGHYTPVYTGAIFLTEPMTLGGLGLQRGQALTTNGSAYAYAWGNADSMPLFGRNRLEAATVVTSPPYTTTSLVVDFDAANASTAVVSEAAIALQDSGGGWFIERNGSWYVVGITLYVDGTDVQTRPSQSRFANAADPSLPDPDMNYAGYLTLYASQIDAFVPEPTAAVLMAAAPALMLRRRRR